MGANNPQGGTIFDPRGMVAGFIKRITTHCYTEKYESSGPCGFREDIFFMFFP